MKKKYLLALVVVILAVVIAAVWFVHKTSAPSYAKKASITPAVSTFDKTKFSTTDPTSPWVVVNKKHPLNPKTYAPADLTSVGNGQFMRAEAATALTQFFTEAKTAGYTLTAASAYRSYDTQVSVYASEVKAFGQTVADSESARPGYSEHQTGWAVDIAGGGCNIADCFVATPQGKWAIANAYKYGFLLRYPADKTAITGYRNESWHFRYVGTTLSNELHKTGTETLEEFFGISGGDY